MYLLLVVLLFSSCKEDTINPLSNYLSTIGKTPIKFEVGNITTSGIEYGGSLSLLKEEIYYTKASSDFSTRNILVSKFNKDSFGSPKEVEFGGVIFNNASDVRISENGNTVYFKMRGNILNDSVRRDGNIWKSKRVGGVWQQAEMLPKQINSKLDEFYPAITNSKNLYFSRELKDTSYDIYVSRYENGLYQEAERLPSYINTNLLESDAYIAPDESYMIFVRMYADDGLGVSDLYISFKENDVWSQPKNMTSLNSPGVDGSPFVTSDGKYLFFTSTRDSDRPEVFDGHLDIYIAKFNIKDWK